MLNRLACFWFPALILCLLGAYRLGFPLQEGAQSRLRDLPYELLGLHGQDVPIDEMILDDLNPDELVIRRYRRPDGVPLWVVLVYFVNTRLGGHDPQLCYVSQGYRIEALPQIRLEGEQGEVTANAFVATRRNRLERVATFWHTAAGHSIANVRRYRNHLFFQGVRENRLYGVFVRISTLETGRRGEAAQWNERFVAEVARRLPDLLHE
jgi:EpsI family protein